MKTLAKILSDAEARRARNAPAIIRSNLARRRVLHHRWARDALTRAERGGLSLPLRMVGGLV